MNYFPIEYTNDNERSGTDEIKLMKVQYLRNIYSDNGKNHDVCFKLF